MKLWNENVNWEKLYEANIKTLHSPLFLWRFQNVCTGPRDTVIYSFIIQYLYEPTPLQTKDFVKTFETLLVYFTSIFSKKYAVIFCKYDRSTENVKLNKLIKSWIKFQKVAFKQLCAEIRHNPIFHKNKYDKFKDRRNESKFFYNRLII